HLHSVYSLHHAANPHNLPSSPTRRSSDLGPAASAITGRSASATAAGSVLPTALISAGSWNTTALVSRSISDHGARIFSAPGTRLDRKSTRLNSSHVKISYAVFCLIKKKDK